MSRPIVTLVFLILLSTVNYYLISPLVVVYSLPVYCSFVHSTLYLRRFPVENTYKLFCCYDLYAHMPITVLFEQVFMP